MDQDEILMDAEERMEKAVSNVQGQLQGLRTGRATPPGVPGVKKTTAYPETPLTLKVLSTTTLKPLSP